MAVNQDTRACTHIKVNGIRCGSPALREEVFCYFHQRMHRGVRTPPRSRLHPIAMLEDGSSIQASLMEVINAVVRNQIDLARARIILRALHIAVKNAQAAKFDVYHSSTVDQIPEYPAAPPAAGPFTEAAVQAAALTQINVPQEEENENDRFNDYFRKMSETAKPPAKVKRGRRRPAMSSRAG